MRPLTMTALSSLASIGLAIVARSYALRLDLSNTISPAMFTNLLILAFCVLATLTCMWIALSYLTLAYAQRATRQKNTLVTFLAHLATPQVRRTLAGGAIALSLAIPQPAYAESYDSTKNEELSDISWGSPDLLEMTAQNNDYDKPLVPAYSTVTPTEAPSELQLSLTQINNPLTSALTNTVTNGDNAPPAKELPQHSQSPPPSPAPPSSPPASYTVKSGDTLWAIARAHLPLNATDSDIAQACLLWAQANPNLANPHLIYPGQSLTIPQENLS